MNVTAQRFETGSSSTMLRSELYGHPGGTFLRKPAAAGRLTGMVFSEQKIRHYTEGDCWALAIAVSELTGLPMYGVGYRDERGGDPNERYWCHVVVQVAYDKYLDIRGIRTADEVFEEFTNFGGDMYPLVKANLQDSIDDRDIYGFIFCESWEVVQADATKLVAAYLPTPVGSAA